MDHPRRAYQRRTIVKRSAAAQTPLGLGPVAVIDSRPVPARQPQNHQRHNYAPRERRRLCLKIDSDNNSGSNSDSGSNSSSYNGSDDDGDSDSDSEGSDGGSNSGNAGNNLEGGLNIRELIKEYSVKGPTAAAHGPSTKQGLLRHRERWLQ